MPGFIFPWERYLKKAPDLLLNNGAKVLCDGREAFPEMLREIAAAKSRIVLEMYIFAEDATGRKFAEALKERARAGLRVCLLFDGVGCLETPRDFFNGLQAAGVEVVEYHPLMPWKPHWGWFFRDHRKILVVDGRVAFTGGLNISDDYAPPDWGGRDWRDAVVRLEGPCVAALEKLFAAVWRGAGGAALPEPAGGPQEPPAGRLPLRIVSSSGLLKLLSIRRSYMHAIDKSQSFIGIMSAYFIPGRSTYRRLIRAAARGVRVAVILPGESDVPWVRWASWALFSKLLKGGVEIYEYQGRIMHAKTAVIDGEFASIGTHNFDHRSLRFNLELAVNIYGPEIAGVMTRVFAEDLARCRRITLKDLKARTLLQRARSRVLYGLRYWL